MRSGTIGNLSIIKKMLFFKLPSNFQTRPLSAPLWPLLLKTPTGLHWSWLSFPRCYGHTYRRLLNAVVVVVEERNTFRCVICPSGAAVVVPVRGKKGLLWLVHTVLISGPLPQTIWASSTCRQVAHDCIVNWIQQQQQQQRVSVKTLKKKEGGSVFNRCFVSHQCLSRGRRHTVRSRHIHTNSNTQCMLFWLPAEVVHKRCLGPDAASRCPRAHHDQAQQFLRDKMQKN